MKHFKKTIAALLVPTLSWAQSAPTASFSYDAVGQVVSTTSPGGRTRQLQWDAFGRQIGETRGGGSVGYGYNGQNALTSVQDPRGLSTSYDRNGFGDARSQSSPDTGASSYNYDANGNVTSRTNAAGQVENFSYDAADRVTSKTVSHPTAGSVTYSYSYGVSGTEAGSLVQVSASGMVLGFAHNLFGQTTTVSQALSGTPTRSTSYGYAANGALTSITYPSGRVVTYSRDGVSRVSAVSSDSTALVSGVAYSPLGAVTGWSFGNGQGVSRTFDTNARITSVSMPSGTRSYGYDADDRIVAISDAVLGSATYSYDDLDRLTAATTSLGSWTYQYDANGNRTGVAVNGSGYAVVVEGGSNRVTASATPSVRTNTYTNDGQTSQVTGGAPIAACGNAVTMGFQADGQLVTSNVLSAVHSPNGLRLQKTAAACAGGVKTNFVYDLAGHLIGEYDASGVVVQETVWLGDAPVAIFKAQGSAAAPYFVYADNLGSPRAVTNAAGQLVWKWDGEPFGASPAIADPSGLGPFVYNLRFPGQYFDSETGYHHNGWREYDPALGRYVQSDPIGLRGGLNTYTYTEGDPIRFVDPEGTDRWGAETSPAIVLTFQMEGSTMFYDPYSQQLISFESNSQIARSSKPKAGDPYSGEVTRCELGKLGTGYGTAKMRTTDIRSRWVHGGGSGLKDSYAPRQGWVPTLGCTRAQNSDVETLCSTISGYRAQGRSKTILYRRD